MLGLFKKIGRGVSDIFAKKKLDQDALDQLEELLIAADLGPGLAARLTAHLAKDRFDKEISADEVRAVLADDIATILQPAEKPLDVAPSRPFVILMAGVNGAGKTTTIGKLAYAFQRDGKRVMLAAGDTFRAAAVEQLQAWGERIGCPVVTGGEGSDPAALAFGAVERAVKDGVDVLILDTAGRLHNKAGLMAELEKIVRVIQKKLPGAPHARLLALDATVGQNAQAQVELFHHSINITGIILTKLDGTARGGAVAALIERFALPVHAIGTGEGIEDLSPFDAKEFARNLVRTDEENDPGF